MGGCGNPGGLPYNKGFKDASLPSQSFGELRVGSPQGQPWPLPEAPIGPRDPHGSHGQTLDPLHFGYTFGSANKG